ncbi:MAG: hypothetical protein Q7U05_07705 [Polaromonas sp.]|nr:hypothetical protein [Polaromonas sp.]
MDKKQLQRMNQPKPHAPGMGGKLENDANKAGHQKPTQKNEGRRTAISRSDRETLLGSQNQTSARKGRISRPNGGR